MRIFLIVFLAVLLNACTTYNRKTRIDDEENRRAKLEAQNIQQMLNSRELPPIEFDFDSAEIKEKSYPTLDKVASILKKYKKIKLIVEGHCDDVGSDAYNEELAMMRAESVKNYIVGKGIYPDSIRTFGYGKRKRMFDDISERARSLKRRAELILTDRSWESVY